MCVKWAEADFGGHAGAVSALQSRLCSLGFKLALHGRGYGQGIATRQ